MNGATANGSAHSHGYTNEEASRPGSANSAPVMENAGGIQEPMEKPSRPLTQIDVAALIINKMIGTGIFTSPFTVLINSPNKRVALGLWGCGFLYTILSMTMYLEFARKLPFTGGELVYLDDVMSRYPLLTSTLYAFYFVFVYTTSTNAMSFAAQIILAASGKTKLRDLDFVDERILRFLAVAVTTVVCLVLFLSNTRSRQLNQLTAFAKVLLLLLICGFGIAYLSKSDKHLTDWGDGPCHNLRLPISCWPESSCPKLISNSTKLDPSSCPNSTWPGDSNKEPEKFESSWQTAFITILFSFHGWENATLVSGEIPSFSVLRRGTMWALGIVGCLYILIATIVSSAFTWNNPKQSSELENYTAVFLNVTNNFSDKEKAENHLERVAVATAIIIAVSALGSMISVTYTCVRVKQSIGWMNILPLSRIWRRSGPLRPRYEAVVQSERDTSANISLRVSYTDRNANPGTPEGGIVLHWIFTVFYVCVTAAMHPIETAISFSANLLVYGHFFIEALVGLGFIWFDPVDHEDRPVNYPAPGWFQDFQDDLVPHKASWMRSGAFELSLQLLKDGPFQVALGLVVMLFSLVLIIIDSWTGRSAKPMDFIRLIVTAFLMAFAWLYWALFIKDGSKNRLYEKSKWEMKILSHGINDISDPDRMCRFCQSPEIELSEYSDQNRSERQLRQALLQTEGTIEHRHPHFDYFKYVFRKRRSVRV